MNPAGDFGKLTDRSLNTPDPTCVFVYGTLKRGEKRASMWPHAPLLVRRATVTAALYDLGDYPAMVEGDDAVVGELWEMNPAQMADTLLTLDQIEGYAGRPDDLYVRVTVDCRVGNEIVPALTYRYARPHELDPAWRIRPVRGEVSWSG